LVELQNFDTILNFKLGKMKFLKVLFFLITTFCFSQHEDLLDIIAEESTIEIRQKKIDSFLHVHERKLETKVLADCYHDLGSKWYFNNWWDSDEDIDLASAIDYTKKSFHLKKSIDSLAIGSFEKTNYNLGYFQYLNGDYYNARNTYLDLVLKGKDDNKVQSANRELGRIYSLTGDFYKALDRFDSYIEFYTKKDSLTRKELSKLGDVYERKAGIYANMGYREFSEEIRLILNTKE